LAGKALVIWVDAELEEAARAALPDHVIEPHVRLLPLGPDLIMSTKARYFEPDWWADPKLVEAALKRARAEKRKKGKK